MAKVDDKMQMIGTAIVSQAEQERKRIIEEANQIRARELAAHKEQIIDKMFDQIQQRTRAVRQKAVRDKAQAEAAAHRELLTRRQELFTSVFAAVRARLAEHVATPAYREELLAGIGAVKDRWDHKGSVVYLREADLDLTPQIEQLLPGCKVEKSKRVKIGGFQLRNRDAGILLDETLDQKMEDQRGWFLENCGLKTM